MKKFKLALWYVSTIPQFVLIVAFVLIAWLMLVPLLVLKTFLALERVLSILNFRWELWSKSADRTRLYNDPWKITLIQAWLHGWKEIEL